MAASPDSGATDRSSSTAPAAPPAAAVDPAVTPPPPSQPPGQRRGRWVAIITGAISVLVGVLYLGLILVLDSRGPLQPPPPEALGLSSPAGFSAPAEVAAAAPAAAAAPPHA